VPHDEQPSVTESAHPEREEPEASEPEEREIAAAEPSIPETEAPETQPEAPEPVSILKSGVIDGMAYTLYSDGAIEAQLPSGTIRFASINELRMHLEKAG